MCQGVHDWQGNSEIRLVRGGILHRQFQTGQSREDQRTYSARSSNGGPDVSESRHLLIPLQLIFCGSECLPELRPSPRARNPTPTTHQDSGDLSHRWRHVRRLSQHRQHESKGSGLTSRHVPVDRRPATAQRSTGSRAPFGDSSFQPGAPEPAAPLFPGKKDQRDATDRG